MVSGEYVGQAGAVEGSAASGGSVGGGRQRDEGEVKASPPVAGSSGGVVGNARAGEQTGGGNERLFKVKPEERADTTGQQAHGSKMKRHLWVSFSLFYSEHTERAACYLSVVERVAAAASH